ncbi:hypothetical protein F5B17DRAFT_450073 [Nemania serpens]|nr:hypothetical protein F5B17DRAFT_450073 [Nemania serpens]
MYLFIYECLRRPCQVKFLRDPLSIVRAAIELGLILAWFDNIDLIPWILVPQIWVVAMAAYYHHDITGAAFVFWALSFFCSYLYFADAQEFETGVILDTLLTIYANRDWMVFWLTRPSFIRWMMGLLTFILAILSDLPGAFMWIKYHLAHPTRLLARGGPLPWSLAFWRQLILQSLFLFMDLSSLQRAIAHQSLYNPEPLSATERSVTTERSYNLEPLSTTERSDNPEPLSTVERFKNTERSSTDGRHPPWPEECELGHQRASEFKDSHQTDPTSSSHSTPRPRRPDSIHSGRYMVNHVHAIGKKKRDVERAARWPKVSGRNSDVSRPPIRKFLPAPGQTISGAQEQAELCPVPEQTVHNIPIPNTLIPKLSTPKPSAPNPSTPNLFTPNPPTPNPPTPNPSAPNPSTPNLFTPNPPTPDPPVPDSTPYISNPHCVPAISGQNWQPPTPSHPVDNGHEHEVEPLGGQMVLDDKMVLDDQMVLDDEEKDAGCDMDLDEPDPVDVALEMINNKLGELKIECEDSDGGECSTAWLCGEVLCGEVIRDAFRAKFFFDTTYRPVFCTIPTNCLYYPRKRLAGSTSALFGASMLAPPSTGAAHATIQAVQAMTTPPPYQPTPPATYTNPVSPGLSASRWALQATSATLAATGPTIHGATPPVVYSTPSIPGLSLYEAAPATIPAVQAATVSSPYEAPPPITYSLPIVRGWSTSGETPQDTPMTLAEIPIIPEVPRLRAASSDMAPALPTIVVTSPDTSTAPTSPAVPASPNPETGAEAAAATLVSLAAAAADNNPTASVPSPANPPDSAALMSSEDPNFRYSLASRRRPRKILKPKSLAASANLVTSSVFDAPSTPGATPAPQVSTAAPSSYSFINPYTIGQPSAFVAPAAAGTSGFTFAAPAAAPTSSFPTPTIEPTQPDSPLSEFSDIDDEALARNEPESTAARPTSAADVGRAANDNRAFLDHQNDEEDLERQFLGLDEVDYSAEASGPQSTDHQQANPQPQATDAGAQDAADMDMDMARPDDTLLPDAEGGSSVAGQSSSSSSAPPQNKYRKPWSEWTEEEKGELDFEPDACVADELSKYDEQIKRLVAGTGPVPVPPES